MNRTRAGLWMIPLSAAGVVAAFAAAQPAQQKPSPEVVDGAEKAAVVSRATLKIPAGKYTGVVIANGGPPETASGYVTIRWKGEKFLYVIEPGKSQLIPFIEGWTLADREATVDLSWTLTKPTVWGITGSEPVTFPEQ